MSEYTYTEPSGIAVHDALAGIVPMSMPDKCDYDVATAAYLAGHATGHQSGHTAGQTRDADAIDRAQREGHAAGFRDAEEHLRPRDLHGVTVHDGARSVQLIDGEPFPFVTMTAAQARVQAARLTAWADALTRKADALDLADRIQSLTEAARSLDDAGIPRTVLPHLTTTQEGTNP